MNKNTIVLVIVVVILAILLVNVQLPVGNKNLTNSTVRERDTAYLRWANVTSELMKSHVLDIADAAKNDNYTSLEMYGAYLERDANISLDQSRYLEVSPGLKPSMEEIQKSLEDYNISGRYTEIGGKNKDNESLIIAANYVREANDHMINASVSVQNYMQDTNR